MPDAPILICYDGTDGAERAIDVAAALLGPHRATVLDIGPPITPAESLATLSPLVPGAAFEELNTDDALERARVGEPLTRRLRSRGEARSARRPGKASSMSPTRSSCGVVLGSKAERRPGAARGSVSHDVAQHAGRPC